MALIETEPENEEESFTITDEMKQYIDYKKTAGQVSKLDTPEDRHKFTREFNRWVKAGSLRPMMPEPPIEADPIPMKIYRIKHFGKQKIFWRDTKGIMYGKETIKSPVMKIIKNANTGQDMEVVERYEERTIYSIDYNKPLGLKMVADALDRCNNPTFYVIAGEKALVGPKEFNADKFDELVDKIRKAANTRLRID